MPMHTIQIKVLRLLSNPDLAEKYNEPDVTLPCPVFEEGQTFVVQGSAQPEGFCSAAWRGRVENGLRLGWRDAERQVGASV